MGGVTRSWSETCSGKPRPASAPSPLPLRRGRRHASVDARPNRTTTGARSFPSLRTTTPALRRWGRGRDASIRAHAGATGQECLAGPAPPHPLHRREGRHGSHVAESAVHGAAAARTARRWWGAPARRAPKRCAFARPASWYATAPAASVVGRARRELRRHRMARLPPLRRDWGGEVAVKVSATCRWSRCRSVATWNDGRRWCTRHWIAWFTAGLPKQKHHRRLEVAFCCERGHWTRSRRRLRSR